MSESLLEKLQFQDEKSLLIQGLPSSIEKQFLKLTFSKSVTPLLRTKKIDFALIFAVNETQLKGIICEVLPALHAQAKLWVAYPKTSSKIATTLNRECSWNCITQYGYAGGTLVQLDHVWIAQHFSKVNGVVKSVAHGKSAVHEVAASAILQEVLESPVDDRVTSELRRSKQASHFFDKLPSSHKKEYIRWISDAKKQSTRSRRLEAAIGKLIAGKKSPSEA